MKLSTFALYLMAVIALLAIHAIRAQTVFDTNAPGTIPLTNNTAITPVSTVAAGYYVETNAVSRWPVRPQFGGEAFIANSNGTLYVLTSATSGTNWTKTNLWVTP